MYDGVLGIPSFVLLASLTRGQKNEHCSKNQKLTKSNPTYTGSGLACSEDGRKPSFERCKKLQGFRISFVDVRAAIDRLPISQDEFALAILRLDNAHEYRSRGELGAAKYELNLLNRMICRET